MARSCSSTFFLLLLLFFVAFVFHISLAGKDGSLRREQCRGACDYRCSKTHHRGNCIDLCNKCCGKCLCVPSGTYGHKDECACYNNWKTKEGKPKCP